MFKIRYYLPLILILTLLSFSGTVLLQGQEDYTVRHTDGVELRLSKFKSIHTNQSINLPSQKHIVLVFSSSCPNCLQQVSEINSISSKLKMPIYGLLFKDSYSQAQAKLGPLLAPYKDIAEITLTEGVELGISGVPEIFIVDEKHIVQKHYVGVISAEDLLNIISKE
jgi:hypothetical protein